jgi:predicted nucleotidyltransferase
MTIERKLTRDELLGNLAAVGHKLHQYGIEANIYVVGGAAIALTINNRRTTSDVDAIVKTNNEAFRAATEIVAKERGLEKNWCLDDVSDYISRNPIGEETPVILPGLNVMVASPEHLLAMKVRAAVTRDRGDLEDIVYLANHLELTDPDQIADLTEKQFNGIYKDSIGRDEYLQTINDAFLEAELAGANEQRAHTSNIYRAYPDTRSMSPVWTEVLPNENEGPAPSLS